jgi:diaminopimelate epimerase
MSFLKIQFAKYHGLGNDYLFLDAIAHPELRTIDLPRLAVAMSHRRLGPGSDGIVIILPSDSAAVFMRIFNPDGSEAQNCGNALRCVARICRERAYISDDTFQIETISRSVEASLDVNDVDFEKVRVNIGKPGWNRHLLPMIGEGEARHITLEILDRKLNATCVSVGNPHCVVFLNHSNELNPTVFGPLVEKHSLFPQKINAGFCYVVNRSSIQLTVWERGAGLTAACGTGAAAAFAAARYRGLVNTDCTVSMPGGDLYFMQDAQEYLHMTGPAVHVYDGVYFDSDYFNSGV